MSLNPLELGKTPRFDIYVALEVAKAELDAIEEYMQFLEHTQDEQLRKMLEYVIRDEMQHFSMMTKWLLRSVKEFREEFEKVRI